FQTPAWIQPWWEVFKPGRLSSIALWKDDRLVGFAPTYLESGKLGERLLPIGIGLSDYCDVLLAPDCTEEAAAAMSSALADIAEWEICELAELCSGACGFALPPPCGSHSEIIDASVAPVLRISEAAGLFDAAPASQWRKIRRARAAFARLGDWKITENARDVAPPAFAELINLHTAHWRTRGQSGVFADPRVGEFHARALPGL